MRRRSKKTRSRSRDAEERKRSIVRAAEEVFVENGYFASALSEIAKRARVTKGLLFHYFGSKEELWNEVKKSSYDHYASSQTRNIGEPKSFFSILLAAIDMKFDFFQKNPNFNRINAWMIAEQDRSGDEVREALQDKSIALCKMAQERGEIRADLDPAHVYYFYICLVDSWFQTRFRYKEAGTPEHELQELDLKFKDDMKKFFTDGLHAGKK